jgi:hypothetical protein
MSAGEKHVGHGVAAEPFLEAQEQLGDGVLAETGRDGHPP